MVVCEGMDLFRVKVIARNPKQRRTQPSPIEANVDTGAELTWLPGRFSGRSASGERRSTKS
jgi:hypothetical protein